MAISFLLKICAFGVIILLILRWLWSRRRLYVLSAKLPGPFALPLIGNATKLMCERKYILERLVDIWKEHGHHPYFRIWLGPRLLVIANGPEAIGKVVQCPSLQGKDYVMRDAMGPWIGDGQLTGTGSAWRARRKILVPIFSRQTIENFIPVFSREFAKMADSLADKMAPQEVDLEEYMHPYSVDIVCQTILNTRLPPRNLSNPNEDFLHVINDGYETIMEAITKPWLMSPFFNTITGMGKRIRHGSDYFRTFIKSAIVQKQAELNEIMNKNKDYAANDNKFRSFIEEVLRADNIGMSLDELIDEIFTIFLASSDPTNNTCCFILLMFAMHPEIQEKALNEIHEVLGEEERPITYEDCLKLTFMDMCVKETIRLFQTGPFSLRRASDDVKIDEKITIPEGTTVLINYFWLHRSGEYWERPNEFYPDHFLPESVAKRPANVYMPFSGGARSCIGKLFAVVAIKVMAVNFLRRYRLYTKGQKKVYDLKLRCDISIVSSEGYKVCLEKRTP